MRERPKAKCEMCKREYDKKSWLQKFCSHCRKVRDEELRVLNRDHNNEMCRERYRRMVKSLEK